jgi:chromosome segregation ATPase
MSNISGVPSYTPPASPDYTTPVIAKIESQIGKISDLYQEISAIMREIAGLKPPDPISRAKDESDESWAARLQEFNSAMADFQSRLNALNSRLHSAQGKLARAQMVLNRLQNSELPNAQRKEANEIQENMRRAQKALEDGVKAAEELSKAEKTEGGSEADSRLELKAIEKKVEVEAMFDGASLKDLVSMFSLAVTAMQASPEKVQNRFTKVPTAGGSGLPPIGTA